MVSLLYRMCEVELGDSKALLVKQNGQFSAIGHKCSHYGAPLSKGYLGQGRVRCPWHGACFNIQSGDIEDFPGLDGVPCFNVSCFVWCCICYSVYVCNHMKVILFLSKHCTTIMTPYPGSTSDNSHTLTLTLTPLTSLSGACRGWQCGGKGWQIISD